MEDICMNIIQQAQMNFTHLPPYSGKIIVISMGQAPAQVTPRMLMITAAHTLSIELWVRRSVQALPAV